MRYFIHLTYLGTHYCGWQYQKNAITVQSTLENHISILLKEDIKLTGCGRTDTGVHARSFMAHFDSERMKNFTYSDFIYKINSFLPYDVAIYNIWPVVPTAHSRFDAISRTYEYHICGIKDPFKKNLSYFVSNAKFDSIDVALFNEACEILKKHNDFSSFAKTGTPTKTNICHIFEAYAIKDERTFVFTIKADRFLRNMVRAITGTALEVAFKNISLEAFENIIRSKNRSKAGESMPAEGLYLVNIQYPENIYIYE